MTTLTITPRYPTKEAWLKGTVAAGEVVHVVIVGGASWAADSGLELAVFGPKGRALAMFPQPDTEQAWETDEDGNLLCDLNLNSVEMVAAVPPGATLPFLFALGNPDNYTFYFKGICDVTHWPMREGDDVPYDLRNFPGQIDAWTALVEEWGAQLSGHLEDTDNPHSVTKAQVGLGNVDNTADADKPVSTATGAAISAARDYAAGLVNAEAQARESADAEKYEKPAAGIPKTDLAESVQTSLGKADTALQEHQSLEAYFNAASYDSGTKKIQFKHDSTVKAEIDAAAFIKDGMVESVAISNGNLVITFNTDAGQSPISIPVTDIFDPSAYYDKTEINAALSGKPSKTDVAAAWDTDWTFAGFTPIDEFGDIVYDSTNSRWVLTYEGADSYTLYASGGADAETLSFTNSAISPAQTISAKRHVHVPTRTSDLENDSGFLTQHQDISGKQDVIVDLAAIRSGAAAGATAVQPAALDAALDGKLSKEDAARGFTGWRLASGDAPADHYAAMWVEWDGADLKWLLKDCPDEPVVIKAVSGNEDDVEVVFPEVSADEYTITATRVRLPTMADLDGKADKQYLTVTPGTGNNADKTTIKLKEGVSVVVLTQHQDISAKADASDLAALAAVVNGKTTVGEMTEEEDAGVTEWTFTGTLSEYIGAELSDLYIQFVKVSDDPPVVGALLRADGQRMPLDRYEFSSPSLTGEELLEHTFTGYGSFADEISVTATRTAISRNVHGLATVDDLTGDGRPVTMLMGYGEVVQPGEAEPEGGGTRGAKSRSAPETVTAFGGVVVGSGLQLQDGVLSSTGVAPSDVYTKSEIDDMIDDLSYTPIAVSAFSVSPSSAEKGSTVESATLSYTLSKAAESATLDGSAVALSGKTGSISLEGLSLKSDKTWTLSVTDRGSASESPHSASESATLGFYWKRHWGAAADATPDAAFILGLASGELASSKKKTFTVNAGAGQHIWYAYPKSWGTATFKVGGFDGGFQLAATVAHVNASGGSAEYYVYRSDNPSLGSTTVVVS